MESVLRCTRSWPWGGNLNQVKIIIFFVIGKVTDLDDTPDI